MENYVIPARRASEWVGKLAFPCALVSRLRGNDGRFVASFPRRFALSFPRRRETSKTHSLALRACIVYSAACLLNENHAM